MRMTKAGGDGTWGGGEGAEDVGVLLLWGQSCLTERTYVPLRLEKLLLINLKTPHFCLYHRLGGFILTSS
jgi:hypothetical protein